jgi:hypothetical protein
MRSWSWSNASRQSRCTAVSAHSTASACISHVSWANRSTSSSADVGGLTKACGCVGVPGGDAVGAGAACRSCRARSVIACHRDVKSWVAAAAVLLLLPLLLLLLRATTDHRASARERQRGRMVSRFGDREPGTASVARCVPPAVTADRCRAVAGGGGNARERSREEKNPLTGLVSSYLHYRTDQGTRTGGL